MDYKEVWKAWIQRFWWLRGVVTAVTLAALVPNFVNLSRYEFLRAFHAVIVSWNVLTTKIGQLIGKIPYLPEISGEMVSTLAFTLSICVPSLFAWFKIARGIRINWEIGDGVVTFLIGFVFSITLVMIYYSIIMGDIEREIFAKSI